MDLERNKAVVRELDALSNGEGDIGRLDELCTPDIMNHALGPNGRRGIEATREFLKKPRRGKWVHSHVIAEGDWVVQFGSREFEWGGGPFRGFEVPAGTCVRDVAFAYRLVDGRIAERWAVRDDLTMLLQLGAQALTPATLPRR